MPLPPGFPAYTRVLHPIVTYSGGERRITRWREVAPAEVTPSNRRVQFSSLAAHAVGRPDQGALADEDLGTLLEAISGHTACTTG